MKICVFGASSRRLDQVFFQEAEQMGRLIGQLGHCVVFGGGADGLMGACARGAKSVGGRVIGIAPHLFNEPGFLLPECDEVFCSEGTWTGLGDEEVPSDEGTEPTTPTLTLPT